MCQAIIILFDVTQMSTLEDTSIWLKSITSLAKQQPVIFLVGNKIDESKKRVISRKYAIQYAKTSKLHYHEVSVKTGKGVDDLFSKISLYVLHKDKIEHNHSYKEDPVQPQACIGCTLM